MSDGGEQRPLQQIIAEIKGIRAKTQAILAEETGVQQSTISNLIKKGRPFSLETFNRIVSKYGEYREELRPFIQEEGSTPKAGDLPNESDESSKIIQMEMDGVVVRCHEDTDGEKLSNLVENFTIAVRKAKFVATPPAAEQQSDLPPEQEPY